MLYKDLIAMCKLKVVALILLTALVAMLLTPQPLSKLATLMLAILGIGLSAASAAVFNHIIDEKIDAQMSRTDKRPLPQKKVSRTQALIWGFSLGIIGFMVLWFGVNHLSAALTLLSLVGYAVFYTMYLKRATPQNIVIGGAAGATPPILGWTAVTGEISEISLALFLIIFVWTPPHFWALALYRHKEYAKAEIPMLPVTHSLAFTRTQIMLYTILLVLVSLLPVLIVFSSWIYLVIVLVLNVIFIYYVYMLIKYPQDMSSAWKIFSYSIKYLMLLFLALLLDHLLL